MEYATQCHGPPPARVTAGDLEVQDAEPRHRVMPGDLEVQDSAGVEPRGRVMPLGDGHGACAGKIIAHIPRIEYPYCRFLTVFGFA